MSVLQSTRRMPVFDRQLEWLPGSNGCSRVTVVSAEAVFDAFGDPTRRQILRALSSGARPVGELAGALSVRRPAVSKHLRVLEGAGLVPYHAEGTRHLYALAPEGYVAAQQWFVETWDTVLDAFAAHLEEKL